MINKYWIDKRAREWGILESESERSGGSHITVGWGDTLPSAQELLARLEDAGFVLLDRIEFLLLSKALDERGEPLSFSPIPPEGPDLVGHSGPSAALEPLGAVPLSLAA